MICGNLPEVIKPATSLLGICIQVPPLLRPQSSILRQGDRAKELERHVEGV